MKLRVTSEKTEQNNGWCGKKATPERTKEDQTTIHEIIIIKTNDQK
jgi:hypothetical protein